MLAEERFGQILNLLSKQRTATVQQLLVGHQQHLAGGGRQHRDRAGQTGPAQHIAEYPARFHPGNGHTGTLRAGAVGFQFSGQHHAHPAAGRTGQYEHFAPAKAALHGSQPGQQCLQLLGRKTGKQGGGL